MSILKRIYLLALMWELSYSTPVFAAATTKTLKDLINNLLSFVNPIVYLLFGGIVVVFLWSIVQALTAVGDPKEREEQIKAAGVRIFLVFLGLSFFTIAKVIYKTFF